MFTTARPRRSYLYMPGSNSRALEKARILGADGLIMDLEDSVTPDAKTLAREQITQALDEGGYGQREVLVRTNGLNGPWGADDLAAAAAMKCDGVVLPKVESRQIVLDAISYLDEAGARTDLPIWCMMETPLGILHAEDIAFAHDRLGGFILGTSDLAKDLGAQHTLDRIPFMASLELCILAGRAAGLAILDGVHLDLEDIAGFRQSCVQGRQLGMDGKTLIHPKTIDTANEVFAPADEEVAWSKRVIDAHAEAEKAGKGVLLIDGKLIENLHVEQAKRLVSMADAIAAMDNAEG